MSKRQTLAITMPSREYQNRRILYCSKMPSKHSVFKIPNTLIGVEIQRYMSKQEQNLMYFDSL